MRWGPVLSESGSAVCLTFPFQLCKCAWIITADSGNSPPCSLFFLANRTLILFWCWVATSFSPEAGCRGTESGLDQASHNEFHVVVVDLGVGMRCSADQREGRRGLPTGFIEGLWQFKCRHRKAYLMAVGCCIRLVWCLELWQWSYDHEDGTSLKTKVSTLRMGAQKWKIPGPW